MKRIIAVLLTSVLALAVSCQPELPLSDTKTISNLTPSQQILLETQGLELVKENDRLALYADNASGNIALYRKESQSWWYSNPPEYMGEKLVGQEPVLTSSQIEITYFDSQFLQSEAGSLVHSINKNGLSCYSIDDGVRFEYEFVQQDITIPLEYHLKDDYLEVSIPIAEVKESGDYTLSNISVLPFFGCGAAGDEGYIMVPDGSGALIDFKNTTNSTYAYAQPIYGSDRTMAKARGGVNSEAARMPVLGIHTQKGGLLCVVHEGDGLATANAQLASMKKKRHIGYFSFTYRPFNWMTLNSADRNARDVVAFAKQTANAEAFAVRYYPLEDDTTYFGMAERYRQYLEEEQNLTSDDKFSTQPLLTLTSYGAVEKKGSFFWIPTNVTVPLTTYKGLETMLQKLDDKGVSGVSVDYQGWYEGGYTGKIPVKGKLEKVLGSAKELNSLLGASAQIGNQVFGGINLTDLYQTGNGYTKSKSVARTVSRAPALQYRYRLETGFQDGDTTPWYLLSPYEYTDVINRFLKSYDKYTFAGVSLGRAGSDLVSDFKTSYGDRIGIQTEYISAFKKAHSAGSVMAQEVNAFLLPYVDFIKNAPAEHSGFDLESTRIPFYQLVINGYKNYALTPMNLSADTDVMFLYAVESGSSLHYIFNDENTYETHETVLENIYNSDYRQWIDEAAEYYKLLAELREKTGKTITGHTQPVSGVAQVSWETGVTVVVNYTDEEYMSIWGPVEARSYGVFEGENQFK